MDITARPLSFKELIDHANTASANVVLTDYRDVYSLAVKNIELTEEAAELRWKVSTLEDAIERILIDHAYMHREVLNLRVALRAETLDRQAEMQAELEGFIATGPFAQYYQVDSPWYFVLPS